MSVGDWNDASGFGTDCAGDGYCCFSKLANCTNVSGSDIVRVTDVACCTGSASVFEHSSIGIGSWSGSLIFSRHSGSICSVCSHSSGHFTASSHPEQLIVCRPSLRLQALQQNPWSRGPPWCWWVQPKRLHFCLMYFHPLHNLFDDMTWAQTATCSHMYVNPWTTALQWSPCPWEGVGHQFLIQSCNHSIHSITPSINLYYYFTWVYWWSGFPFPLTSIKQVPHIRFDLLHCYSASTPELSWGFHAEQTCIFASLLPRSRKVNVGADIHNECMS